MRLRSILRSHRPFNSVVSAFVTFLRPAERELGLNPSKRNDLNIERIKKSTDPFTGHRSKERDTICNPVAVGWHWTVYRDE